MGLPITLKDVRAAADRIRPVVIRTPVMHSAALSQEFGCQVYLKLENMQVSGSYKIRGSYNKISQLDEKVKGIIAASAGNHAQGVALGAAKRGWSAKTTIVMPAGAPEVKKARTRMYGIEPTLVDGKYDDARKFADELAVKEGLTPIHAFDDWDVIAGQGTIALEILEECPDVELIVVPVGGGGLLSGIAVAMSEVKPSVRLIGVEGVDAAPFIYSFAVGHRAQLLHPASTIADGIQVRMPGEKTWDVFQQFIGAKNLVSVSDADIVEALGMLAILEGQYVEGAGAAALAALLELKRTGSIPKDKAVVVVVSGRNIDAETYQRLLDAALAAGTHHCEIRVRVPDGSGELAKLLQPITVLGLNLASVATPKWHRGSRGSVAVVDMVVEVPRRHLHKKQQLLSAMSGLGYSVQVL